MDPADAMPVDFLDAPLRALAGGANFAQFAASVFQELPPRPGDTPETHRAKVTAFAREVWRSTPDPANGWRPRTISKPGRNDPCECGSGRKYKRCCEPFAADVPAMEMSPHVMGGLLFVQGPPAWREPAALRRMPAATLAAAADAWGEAHGGAAVIELLEPIFLDPAGLVGDHEAAFDVLLDAMLEAGLEARRFAACRAVAEKSGSRVLRCTARARLSTMAGDRGDHAAAWAEFKVAQRERPDDPQLLHLEMTLLLGEGRNEEAKLRGPLLAARARKLGYDELAEILQALAAEGFSAARHLGSASQSAEEQDWVRLLREAIRSLDAARFRELHTIDEVGGDLSVSLTKKAQRLVKPWTARYGALPPVLTQLDGDVDNLLDDVAEAGEWLRANADACSALPVLDDLLIAVRVMARESGNPMVHGVGVELALAASALVVEALQAWPTARLPWGVAGNRPLLRVVSHGIDAAMQVNDPRADEWLRWMLRRNPDDNHGWRETLRERLLRAGDAGGVLQLMQAYPDDEPPAQHDLALALFMLGRRAEAEQTLRDAHAGFPAFVAALVPPVLDRPPLDVGEFVTVGGADHAWEWRQGVREGWVRSGALDWLAGLNLPEQSPRKPARARKSGAAKQPGSRKHKTGGIGAASPLPHESQALLRNVYGKQLPWLLGWLACFAWAPGAAMPSAWLAGALAPVRDAPAGVDLQPILDALMEQYNQMNGQRLARGEDVPLPRSIAAGDGEGWIAFAAGFVQGAETQGRGAWQAVGAVTPRSAAFKPLYQLAARAAPGADGWRASTETSAPLLSAIGEPEPVRKLLEQALLPLWRAATAPS